MDKIDQITKLLADIHSVETRKIRIDRTGVKQWRKSRLLREQIAKHGQSDKWEQVKKTYDSRQHQ